MISAPASPPGPSNSSAALASARRLVLVVRGMEVPLVTPMAYWWDGRHLWMVTAGSSGKVRTLRREPEVVAYVPPAGDGPGAVVRGHVRVFSIGDPLGLAVHAAPVSGAVTMVALRNLSNSVGYALDLPQLPSSWLPHRRVAVKLDVEDVQDVVEPPVGLGMAPALPEQVPPAVRRRLAGVRRVVVAADVGAALAVVPAVWGAGFELDLPAGARLPDGQRVVVMADVDPMFRPSRVAGLALEGSLDDGRLVPDRVSWWQGFDRSATELVPSFVLPD